MYQSLATQTLAQQAKEIGDCPSRQGGQDHGDPITKGMDPIVRSWLEKKKMMIHDRDL
jgi:hypothetical protein